MRLKAVRTEYRVVSGSPQSTTSYHLCKNFRDAKKVKRDCERSNPHQGGGYHIIKVVTFASVPNKKL